MRYKRVFNKTA